MIRLSETAMDNGPVGDDELVKQAERLYLLGCVWETNRSFDYKNVCCLFYLLSRKSYRQCHSIRALRWCHWAFLGLSRRYARWLPQ